MTNERIDDLLALAALGELSEDERRELDEAIAADPQLGDELDEMLDTAARLQRAGEVPPPALKARVVSAVDGVEQARAGLVAVPESPAEVTDIHRGDIHRADIERGGIDRGRRRWWVPVAAAAAVVALIVGGILTLSIGDGGVSPFDAVVESDDAEVRVLEGELPGYLAAVYSPEQSALALDGAEVPTLDERSTYQLWLVDEAGATSVGLFRPDGSGRVEARFDDVNPLGFLVGVTIEPAGGSDEPTLPVVAGA